MQRLLRVGQPYAPHNWHVGALPWQSQRKGLVTDTFRRRCAPIPNRSLLSITGSQASTFLNGQITTQIPHPESPEWLKKGRGIYSAILGPQGRVMYDIFIYPLASTGSLESKQTGYIIEYDHRVSEIQEGEDTPKVPSLLSLLKRYVLRSKVRISDISCTWDLWSVWGSDQPEPFRRHAASWRWGRSGAVEPLYGDEEFTNQDLAQGSDWVVESSNMRENVLWMVDRRAPGLGARVLLPKGEKPFTTDVGVADEYTLRRISHGIPEGRDDIPPLEAFPMDSNLDMMGGVDFRKGCYVGQELTVRTYHTGVIRKRIFPVQLKSSEDIPKPPLQAPIVASSGTSPSDTPRPRPRGTGKLLSSVGNSALALLRLEHFEAAEQGVVSLNVNSGGDGTGRWNVIPRRPDWWPTHTPEEMEHN